MIVLVLLPPLSKDCAINSVPNPSKDCVHTSVPPYQRIVQDIPAPSICLSPLCKDRVRAYYVPPLRIVGGQAGGQTGGLWSGRWAGR